jgi:hypothetical protein
MSDVFDRNEQSIVAKELFNGMLVSNIIYDSLSEHLTST